MATRFGGKTTNGGWCHLNPHWVHEGRGSNLQGETKGFENLFTDVNFDMPLVSIPQRRILPPERKRIVEETRAANKDTGAKEESLPQPAGAGTGGPSGRRCSQPLLLLKACRPTSPSSVLKSPCQT